jgi:hypothetical protein
MQSDPPHAALAAALITLALAASPTRSADAAPPLPEAVADAVAALPESKRAYLLSDDARDFAGSWEKLYRRLRGRDSAEIEAYVDAMLHVEAAKRFNPDTDMGEIPLNTESEEFNSWKLMNPRELATRREPGPIHLSYYLNSYRSGIRTFAGAPLAIYPEDLVAGEVESPSSARPWTWGPTTAASASGPRPCATATTPAGRT